MPARNILLLFLGIALTAGTTCAATPQSGSIVHDSLMRSFLYYVPDNLPGGPAPLVFTLHGGGGNALKSMEVNYEGKWNEAADREGFIVIYPEGRPDPGDRDSHHWNDCRGDVTDTATLSTEDDVGFISTLIDWADENFNINLPRVYVSGASNGGMMSHRLARELDHRFAAAAGIIANQPVVNECVGPDSQIPLLVMNGTAEDSIMPYEGGCITACSNGRGTVLSTQDTLDFWIGKNHANSSPVIESLPDVVTTDHSDIDVLTFAATKNGEDVVFYRVNGGGHTIPGPTQLGTIERLVLGWKNQDIVAADEIWAFFVANEKAPFVMNAGLNDAWYNRVTDGQGFFITVFPELGLVSLAWFTYDTELPAGDASANLGDAGHRWLTALGPIDGNSAVMNIELTSGGLFDTATEIRHTDPVGSDGTITLTFDDCSSGLVEYDISSIGQQGSVPIQRIANDNIALCEALIEK